MHGFHDATEHANLELELVVSLLHPAESVRQPGGEPVLLLLCGHEVLLLGQRPLQQVLVLLQAPDLRLEAAD